MIPGIAASQLRSAILFFSRGNGEAAGIGAAIAAGNTLSSIVSGTAAGIGAAAAISIVTKAAVGAANGIGTAIASPPVSIGAGAAAGAGTAIAGGKSWETTFSASLSSNSPGWNGFNHRQVFGAGNLSVSGTKVRLTLRAASSTEAAQIASMWMGHAAASGDPYDFDGTQVQVTVGGNTTFTAPINTDYVIDEIVYPFDETRPFVVAYFFNNAAADIVSQALVSGCTSYTKSMANETSLSNATTGYTVASNVVRFISRIEVTGNEASVGAASGIGTAEATGFASSFAGAGAASGTGIATGVGNSFSAAATGAASGIGTATAVSPSMGDGLAAGTGTATATATATAAVDGLAAGTGTADAEGDTIGADAVGAASGTGTASGVGRAWQNTLSQTMTSDNAGWNGFNMRQHLSAATLSTSGNFVRLTLNAGAALEGASIDAIRIGHAALSGDAYDFDGTQVQVRVGGATSFLISVGTAVVTDEVAYALDETKAFIIAAHFNSAANDIVRQVTLGGASNYFKSAADETATSNVSTYTLNSSILRLISKIEVSP